MSNVNQGNTPILVANSWMQNLPGNRKLSRGPRIRIGSAHYEWNHVVVTLIAMSKSFFCDEGLEDVELVAFESEEASIECISKGRTDFAVDPATSYVLKAIHAGSDLYIIAPRRATHSFYLFGQKGMSSVKDLKGGRINAFTPGDEMTTQASQVIRDAGMVPDVDVKITFYEGEMHDIFGMENAFRRGETQAVLAQDVQVEHLKADGYPVLVNLKEAYLPRQDRVFIGAGSMVNSQHHIVKSFLKGIIKANRYFLEKKNRQEIREIVKAAGFVMENQRLFETIFDSLYTRIPADCHLPLEGIEQAIKEQIAAGNIDKTVTLDRVVRIKPLQEAQKELGII